MCHLHNWKNDEEISVLIKKFTYRFKSKKFVMLYFKIEKKYRENIYLYYNIKWKFYDPEYLSIIKEFMTEMYYMLLKVYS